MLIRWRIIIAILGSIGMAIIYGLKVNLSMAIVSMVDQTVIEETNKTNTLQSKVSFWYYKYITLAGIKGKQVVCDFGLNLWFYW